MKKVLAIILSVLILVSSFGIAEVNFNINDYSVDELAEIYSMISVKLFECIRVPAGLYVVGEDLPAGTYSILSNSAVKENTSNDFAHVGIFNSMEDFNKDSSLFNDEDGLAVKSCNTLWGGFSCELTEGMVLYVKLGIAGVTKVNKNIFSAFWN